MSQRLGGFEMMRNGLRSLAMVMAVAVLASGCTEQLKKTFDSTPDPELQRTGAYPNINVAGGTPPGKLMTPEELARATADLKAKGKRNDPAIGAKARRDVAAHPPLKKNAAPGDAAPACSGADKADATKCPQ